VVGRGDKDEGFVAVLQHKVPGEFRVFFGRARSVHKQDILSGQAKFFGMFFHEGRPGVSRHERSAGHDNAVLSGPALLKKFDPVFNTLCRLAAEDDDHIRGPEFIFDDEISAGPVEGKTVAEVNKGGKE